MGDATKSLDILITTKAELAGAKALEQTLEQSIGRAKALGNLSEVKKLSGELDTMRGALKAATEGNSELAQAEKEGAEATEFLHKNHRALHRLLGMVGGEAEHVGGSLLNAFRGPVGPILALVGLFQIVKNKIEEDNKALDELAETAAKPMGSGIDEYRKAIDEANISLGKFLADLKHAGNDPDPIKTEIDNATELLTAQIEARKRNIEVMMKEEEAAIRLNGAKSGKSQDQIDAEVSRAKDRAQVLLDQLDSDAARAKGSTALKLEQMERDQAQPGLEKDAREKRERADAARRKFEDEQAQLKNLSEQNGEGEAGKKNLTYLDEQKRRTAAEEKIKNAESAKITAYFTGSKSGIAGAEKDITDAQSELGSLDATKASRSKSIDQLRHSEKDRSETTANAEADASEADNQLKTNDARRKRLPGQIDQREKVEGVQDQSKRTAEILETHGGKMNETLGQITKSLGYTHEQTVNLANKIADGTTRIDQAFAALTAAQEKMFAQLAARIARIESNTNLH